MTVNVADMACLDELLREQFGNSLGQDKDYLVKARLDPICKDENIPSISALLRRIRTVPNGPLEIRVLEALLTVETSFFRHRQSFESLREELIPALMAKRQEQRSLYLWSAACSTGQEAYSLAILLKEHFPELEDWDVRILATDVSSEVLEKAQKGVFTTLEANRGLASKLLIKYFVKQGNDWAIKESISSMVEFQKINLAKPLPALPTMDIVFLRNVLVYMHNTNKAKLLHQVQQVMAADGMLFLGPGEGTFELSTTYEKKHSARGSNYYSLPTAGSNLSSIPREQAVELTVSTWSILLNTTVIPVVSQDFKMEDDWPLARIQVTGSWNGDISLHCPKSLSQEWACSMLGINNNQLEDDDINDTLGELANVLAGNLKSLLPGKTKISPPIWTKIDVLSREQESRSQAMEFIFDENGTQFVIYLHINR